MELLNELKYDNIGKYSYIEIDVTEEQYNSSLKYANKWVEIPENMKFRAEKKNQPDLDTNKSNEFNGKLFEFAVYNLLKKQEYIVSEPSTKILKLHEKSFKQDLTALCPITKNVTKYIIKSQTVESMRSHSLSWMFSINDPTLKNLTNDDILVCGLIRPDILKARIIICSNAKFYLSKSRLLEPNKPSQKGLKLVFYYEKSSHHMNSKYGLGLKFILNDLEYVITGYYPDENTYHVTNFITEPNFVSEDEITVAMKQKEY